MFNVPAVTLPVTPNAFVSGSNVTPASVYIVSAAAAILSSGTKVKKWFPVLPLCCIVFTVSASVAFATVEILTSIVILPSISLEVVTLVPPAICNTSPALIVCSVLSSAATIISPPKDVGVFDKLL